MIRQILCFALIFYANATNFHCIKGEPETCAYSASSECGSFVVNSGSDIDAWLTANNGQPCSVIGGSLTIQQRNIKAADLAKMMPLVAVCGSVTIQQLATGTLEGLNNLSYIGGSFFLAQNARPWASGGDVHDVSALSKLTYVGGAMMVAENYYLTEDKIAAAFGNLNVAGAVDIEFYANRPTVPGAVASKTGSVNECTTNNSPPISTTIVEGSVSLTIDVGAAASSQDLKTGMTNAIADLAKVGADQVAVSITSNTRRLRSLNGRRLAAALRIDYTIRMPVHVSASAVANNLNKATPSAIQASFTNALADVGMKQTVSVASITSRISFIALSTTTRMLETDASSATSRHTFNLIATLTVFTVTLLASCRTT